MTETQEKSMSTDSLPETPRPITDKVRKRLWQEPITRSWSIVTFLILLTFLFVSVQGYMQWSADARMIDSGDVVKAIGFADGAKINGRPLPVGQSQPVYITYEHKGTKYSSQGALVHTGKQYVAGEPFDIRLDPSDPRIWTNRDEAASLREKMIASILTLIFTIGSTLATIFAWWRNRSLWCYGELRQGRVLEHRQSALAPKSVALHCAVRVVKQEHLMTIYVPQSAAVPAKGQSIALLTNENATRGIALANYHT